MLSLLPSPHSAMKLYVPDDSRGNLIWLAALEPALVSVVFHMDKKDAGSEILTGAGERVWPNSAW